MSAKGKDCPPHRTFFTDKGTTFIFHVCFIGKPLDAFSKRVHVRILEYVDGHDDLIISRIQDRTYCQTDIEGMISLQQM